MSDLKLTDTQALRVAEAIIAEQRTKLQAAEEKIAELTPMYEVLAEVANWLNQKYGLHFRLETIEKLKQLNKKERVDEVH